MPPESEGAIIGYDLCRWREPTRRPWAQRGRLGARTLDHQRAGPCEVTSVAERGKKKGSRERGPTIAALTLSDDEWDNRDTLEADAAQIPEKSHFRWRVRRNRERINQNSIMDTETERRRRTKARPFPVNRDEKGVGRGRLVPFITAPGKPSKGEERKFPSHFR